ncbi:MAG: hypothetical protein DMG65_03935 [Candidatus Angelobacter sp. Gp1-AA117]|nr:MAG: hypothetical protein DMG65_03935 [Candidatus Angelobacter sp. Gp1-AA117]
MAHPVTHTISDQPNCWPALPLAAWKDTCATLHMWTQIVGKVRLALTPAMNHWWNVPLYVSARGLTTSPMPYDSRAFEVEFDFVEHKLFIRVNDGTGREIALVPRSVADFYKEFMSTLHGLGLDVPIWKMPVEIPDPIPFDEDRVHASYDPEYAHRFWQILVSADSVLKEFRSRFIGKSSPVHFFWGSFDLAVTRFSGRKAPEREGADPITREAYSHEVISVGFWPGSGDVQDAAFYAYAAPEPAGFPTAPVRPQRAFYHPQLKEFILMYEDVRSSKSPTAALLDFAQSTYEAGATLGQWNREALERPTTNVA